MKLAWKIMAGAAVATVTLIVVAVVIQSATAPSREADEWLAPLEEFNRERGQ